MIHRLVTLTLLQAVVATAFAVRAAGGWNYATQGDGTQIEVKLCGDEWLHYFVTRDGVPLLMGDEGDLCYAYAYGFGMKSSGIVAHERSLRTEDEWQHVSSLKAVQSVESLAAAARSEAAVLRRASLQPTHLVGDYRGLVVLADFPDQSFRSATPKADYEAMLNEEGYAGDERAVGSVHDYFIAQSHGLFSLSFDVVGPVTVSKNHDEYPEGYQVRDTFMPEVLKAIASDVDFSRYDWDGDGEVDQVMVIYAGYGANESFANNDSTYNTEGCIWPMEWELGRKLTFGGTKVGTFAVCNELSLFTDSYSGIGTICHEFSHCLGLPDLYDTNTEDDQSVTEDGGIMDSWEIMDGGNYNDGGWCPPNYSAFERAYCGWLTPTLLSADTVVSGMPSLSVGDVAYKVVNETPYVNVDEYYLLENRQQTGWDRSVPGHGLLVWHIDYHASFWRYNHPNADVSHLRCAAICADNDLLCHYEGRRRYLSGATYPYTDKQGKVNNQLTDTSTPAAKVFNFNLVGQLFMGKPIKDIAEASDGTVSFSFFSSNATGIAPVAADGQSAAVGVWSVGGTAVQREVGTGRSSSGKSIYIIKGKDGATKKIFR